MSLSGAVLDAGVLVVEALTLASPNPPVRRRKVVEVLDGDPATVIVMAVGRADATTVPIGGGRWVVPYPLSAVIVMASGGKRGDNEPLRVMADTVTTALLDWWPGLRAKGLTAVNDVHPRLFGVFDPVALDAAKQDWAAVNVTVEVIEYRRTT